MKKTFKIIAVTLAVLLTLSGCGSDDSNQTINRKDDQPAQQQEKENDFYYLMGEVKVVPGSEFVASQLPEYNSVYQERSCAFDRTDNIYCYDDCEITTYMDEQKKETVYSIYFVSEEAKTAEGLGFGDTVEKMESLYGKEYELFESEYTYTVNGISLIVLFEEGKVVSIEYVMADQL